MFPFITALRLIVFNKIYPLYVKNEINVGKYVLTPLFGLVHLPT